MLSIALKGSYVCIHLDNIVHNYKEACRRVGNKTQVTCVVKSDAYGHGEIEVVKVLVENGLSIICVSTIIEGIRLRKEFPKDLDILILGYTPKFLASKVAEYNLTQTISTLEEALNFSKNTKTRIHIKVNTGMNRLGFSVYELDQIVQISYMEQVEICGVFTHLHSSDSKDKTSAENQFKLYCEFIQQLEKKGVEVGIKHVCNSAGIIDLPHMHLDMVREGIMLYGLYPSKFVNHKEVYLKECMEFIAYIAHITKVKKGEGLSYGHSFIAAEDMLIATVNLGYSDGLFRHMSNNGDVLIRGRRCAIVGRVCMNMFLVNITEIDEVKVEDPVIIFGQSQQEIISIDEVAKNIDTISYEVVCRTGYSVPRVYIKNGQIIKVEQELLIEH